MQQFVVSFTKFVNISQCTASNIFDSDFQAISLNLTCLINPKVLYQTINHLNLIQSRLIKARFSFW